MRHVSLLFHDVFVERAAESGFSSPAADRYKLPLEHFKAQIEALPRGSAARLTFDDGGISYYTIVADLLEAREWRGYCFVSTDFIGTRGFLDISQIRKLDARGHVIGTHSASHPGRFSGLTPDQMRREWSKSRQVLEDLLGHTVTVGSVPGGYFSKMVATTAAEMGLQLLFNSEPAIRARSVDGCTVAGRYTIRRRTPRDLSRKLVQPAPWTRCGAWVSWNAKGLIKPLLGSSYPHVADRIHSLLT
jgi:peptidoglycan/xylan/chitin deacetylase (PgdA/CDA1 family)